MGQWGYVSRNHTTPYDWQQQQRIKDGDARWVCDCVCVRVNKNKFLRLELDVLRNAGVWWWDGERQFFMFYL